MYFNFEDYRPDTPTVEPAISRREGILLSLLAHAVLLGLVLYLPTLPLFQRAMEAARQAAIQRQLDFERMQQDARFVFVQPKLDQPAPAPPPRAALSDKDRRAQTLQRPPEPLNTQPFMRGDSPEPVESQQETRMAGRGPGTDPHPAPPTPMSDAPPGSNGAPAFDRGRPAARPDSGEAARSNPGGSLGDALQNLQKYVQNQQFENPQGGGGAFGPAIQFDTKGVEFGPWIRRFIAQIKRNWFIPYAAMSMRGHVVITFNVHKDGRITDLHVLGPSEVEAFNNAAFNALAASNPTQSLPPEYPSDRAFFTVTFYYNEVPPSP